MQPFCYATPLIQLLVYNGVSISDAVSRTGYNISNAQKLSTFVSSHLKAFKDRLLLKIRFRVCCQCSGAGWWCWWGKGAFFFYNLKVLLAKCALWGTVGLVSVGVISKVKAYIS